MYFSSLNEPENTSTSGILESTSNGWRTMWKDDGTDYPALLNDFLAGKLDSEEFKSDYSTSVHQVNALGRRFIFKHYYKLEPRREKRLWHRMAGTFYSRIFKITQKAVQRGCTNAQEIFLVTEQFQGPYSKEVWLIAEYIEGSPLGGHPLELWREKVFRTIAHIHQCGMASNDLHPHNMILTPDNEIKLIDVSINSPVIICQMKDLVRLRRHFGDEPPFKEILLSTPGRRFLYSMVRTRDWFRRTVRRLQGKRKDGRKKSQA
ncbi:hypothetical protein C4J81_07950 [Deltaproteobacteria bacterium Smac51]|nr:hypothetical protein C4J81_07950 [Deltaproteobacteria bacterium Smac51]